MAEPANLNEYRHTFLIAAKPERIFKALTDPRELEKWFAEQVRIETKQGGRYAFWGKHTLWGLAESSASQQITVFEPPRRLGEVPSKVQRILQSAQCLQIIRPALQNFPKRHDRVSYSVVQIVAQ